MATVTLGTSATNSLVAIPFGADQLPTDFAVIAQGIRDDQNVSHPVVPGAFSQNGLLIIPNRGVLKVLPGDYVARGVDGWPILVSAFAIANGNWTHT